MRLRKSTIAATLAAFASFAGYRAPACATDVQNSPQPSWPTKSWPASTPEEQGMDSASVARLIEAVGSYKQDSFLVIRHGTIVAEAYYAPYMAGIPHDLRSVTKSVVSTLTAIEIDRGLLDSVDHPVLDLFPEKTVANVDDNKRAMTVQNLLDMTSGIDWQERNYTRDETIVRFFRSPDCTEFVLNQPMSDPPGSRFNYNSGNPYVLSALITRKTGQSAFDFAKKELFEPLGITSARWGQVDAQGVTDGEAGLFLSPHDMARLGYLYLHEGTWDGRQIIPSSWVARAKEGKVSATNGFHYANLWWSLRRQGALLALGRHSQAILVLPKLDIVAVMTGILRDSEVFPMRQLVDDISDAVKSEAPLPIDPIAKSLLAAAIHEAATERPGLLGGSPELAKQISGKTIRLEDNDRHVKTFSLNFFESEPSWVITTSSGKPDQPTERVSGLMGLDGAFRNSPPGPYGIYASKGRWLNEHTFSLERRILGHSETQTWTLTLDAEKVTVNFEDTDGFKAQLHGEMSK
jgi:CubicO group peptidase (beta-lactamase class C family)